MTVPPHQQAIQASCVHPSGHFVEFPRDDIETSIPARFEKIARQFPGRLAVKTGHRALTYQELNRAANRVAHAILERLGDAQEPVAVLAEQGCSLFIAILGILKAGKICVVLDPAFPKARNRYLLEDSQASILVTDSPSLPSAREYAPERCRVVDVDDLDSRLPADDPAVSIAADRFAFLVYTSGSTGQPKGVIQNHRNLLHDGRIYCNGLHLCADDRVALLYSCSASQGLKVTFAALLSGAALYPYEVTQRGVADLAAWLNQEEITIYVSLPILFRHFAGSLSGQERFRCLRIIQLGSDVVTRTEVDLYREHFARHTVLVVRLGTTETGTLRRMFFDGNSVLEDATVPVGYEVEDAEILLLDDDGTEVGFDAVGEIAVKSRYISPGYWRRPELTRDTLPSDPEGGDTRMYRTGDLGRIRSDGLLHHLGRKDFQLKVRGYRVEAGEIEAILQAQRDVKEAVVASVKASSEAESDRLIAYIVPRGGPVPSIQALRAEVRRKLPAYMVPSDFVFMDALPRTANGKIDRRALPAPDRLSAEVGDVFALPRTPLEATLAGIWAEVLGLDTVAIHADFFDLGGHSLLAMKVVSRIRKALGRDLPLRQFFESPTIEELARRLGAPR